MIHSLKKVIYTNQRPCERDVGMFLKKFDEWSYEDEYRLVSHAVKETPQWKPWSLGDT